MKKITRSFVLALCAICALNIGSAQASLDTSDDDNYGGQGTLYLNPDNDTRVTLILLLSDAGLAQPHTPPKLLQFLLEPPFALSVIASMFDKTATEKDTRHSDGEDDVSSAGNDLQRELEARMADDTLYSDGEGNVCDNVSSAGNDFQRELKASPVPAAEQEILLNVRQSMDKACSGLDPDDIDKLLRDIKSASGREFAAYLKAAGAFYRGAVGSYRDERSSDFFLAARSGFTDLMKSGQPWLRETASYMVGRTMLNGAQKDAFGDYGELKFENINAGALNEADAAFRAYLRNYPEGLYAASARGLLRRVAWLGRDDAKLADAFDLAFALPAPASRNVSAVQLAYEADRKLLGNFMTREVCDENGRCKYQPGKEIDIHEPLLLATIDLMLMRKGERPFTRNMLEAQQEDFADHQELFNYLLAAHAFYSGHDPAETLKLLDSFAPKPNMNYLQFSEQVLKGLAQEASNKPEIARAHWIALIPLVEPVMQRPIIEHMLGDNYKRSGNLAAVYAPDSLIRSPGYRETLLLWADPPLLRQQATSANAAAAERQFALRLLLEGELTKGKYRDFLDDLRLMPAVLSLAEASRPYYKDNLKIFDWPGASDKDSFACPALRDIAAALAHNPHAERSLICLGEFQRLTDQQPTSRLDTYKKIIANPKAERDVRAYALYRAVYCWAPGGSNTCDNSDAPLSQREQWFRELKTKYRSTKWANDLKYFW